MENKQHEYIFRAFISSPVPEALKRGCPDLLSIDSVLGGYCTKALKGIQNDHLERVNKALQQTFVNPSRSTSNTTLRSNQNTTNNTTSNSSTCSYGGGGGRGAICVMMTR